MRAWNDKRLANLQFSIVFDVVEFLQLVDADFVHFCDRSERLASGDDVGRSARGRRWWRGFPSDRQRAAERGSLGVLDLLLQAQNLLRKRVDFDVLLVNLLCQAEELGGFRSARGGSGALGVRVDRKRNGEKKNRERAEEASHGQAWHLRSVLASWRRFAFRVHSR
jgi:hypothetical protein